MSKVIKVNSTDSPGSAVMTYSHILSFGYGSGKYGEVTSPGASVYRPPQAAKEKQLQRSLRGHNWVNFVHRP